MTEKAILVSCPTCKKDVIWDPDNPYRPFCSERCKLIDLGAWANEDYRIPSEPADPEELEQALAENPDFQQHH